MIQTSEQINEIAAALAKAQGTLENVAKDRENPHFRSRYATLAGVLDEVRPKLAAQGISIFQAAINGESDNIGVATRLLHSSGQWIESAVFVRPTKFDAQGVGSVLTYLRRYSLMAVAGVGPEDDDGNAAVGRPQERVQTNGATRAAAAPPPPARPVHVNGAALPAHPEEDGATTAARQRVRMLIDRLDHAVKTAKNSIALDAAWTAPETEDSLGEIEKAGPDGAAAASMLRSKYARRADQLKAAEAMA